MQYQLPANAAADKWPPVVLKVAQQRDALDLLCSLPDACTPLVFFDPQFRGVLNYLKFGNEGARQRDRFKLAQMTEDYIDSCCREIARVGLRASSRKTISNFSARVPCGR